MAYSPELCDEKHKRTDEQLTVHDRRLNNQNPGKTLRGFSIPAGLASSTGIVVISAFCPKT